MLKFITDEHIDGDLIKGLIARNPQLDIIRVQDIGLRSAEDPLILARAAETGRILITYDRQTMTDFAYERISQGLPMLGVFILKSNLSFGKIIEDLLILADASTPDEWENQVFYLSS